MSGYACAACRLRFASREDAKAHYGSALHRCNIDRKVNGLPTMDEKSFQATQPTPAGDAKDGVAYHCKICNKTFQSVQTLGTHLQSAKHKSNKAMQLAAGGTGKPPPTTAEKEKDQQPKEDTPAQEREAGQEEGEPADADSGAEEEGEEENGEVEVPIGSCLFCNHVAPTVEENARHMLKTHEFAIPLWDRVTDLAGLVQYLQRKVHGGMCLWCGERTRYFGTLEALRNHMRRNGHCRVPWTDHEEEYRDYYDLPARAGAGAALPDDLAQATIAEGRLVITARGCPPVHTTRAVDRIIADESLPQHRLLLAAARAHVTAAEVVRRDQFNQVLRRTQKADLPRTEKMAKSFINIAISGNPPAFHGY